MYLRTYLRNKLATKLIPLLKKDKCEICEATDNLQVHHMKLFSEIVNETLKELNLEYKKEVKEYSPEELNLITCMVLGKHLDIEYLTLCDSCHDNIHESTWTEISCSDKYREHCNKLKFMKAEKEKQNIENLIPYLDNILDKRMFKDERLELIKKINLKDNRCRLQKSYGLLNKYFKENKLPYTILSEKDGKRKSTTFGKRYWKVIINKDSITNPLIAT